MGRMIESYGPEARRRGAKQLGGGGTVYLLAWTIIFLAVTLQMSTALRPILGRSERWHPTQRKFFLEHWGDNLGRESAP